MSALSACPGRGLDRQQVWLAGGAKRARAGPSSPLPLSSQAEAAWLQMGAFRGTMGDLAATRPVSLGLRDQ